MEKKSVTGKDLPDITEEHLKQWGITKFGHRTQLMKEIKKLCNQTIQEELFSLINNVTL